MKIKAMTVAVSAAGLCAALVMPAAAASAAPGAAVRTVATGFAGPLHVSVALDGQIYVADAFLGQIDRVDPRSGMVTPLVTGLHFSPGVSVRNGQVFFTDSIEPESGEGQGAATLQRRRPDGAVKPVADLLAYELAHNPDGQPQGTGQDADSNPYAVLALPGRTLVADAAGNDVVEVRGNGTMRTLTVFPVSRSTANGCATATNNGVPNGGCDPVPTDLALGSDGYLYVSGLGAEREGFVWKVDATTGAILSTRGGLPPLTGVAAGRDGVVYAASLFTNQVFRFGPNGGTQIADVPGPTGLDYARGVLYAGSASETGPGSLLAISPAAFHQAS